MQDLEFIKQAEDFIELATESIYEMSEERHSFFIKIIKSALLHYKKELEEIDAKHITESLKKELSEIDRLLKLDDIFKAPENVLKNLKSTEINVPKKKQNKF